MGLSDQPLPYADPGQGSEISAGNPLIVGTSGEIYESKHNVAYVSGNDLLSEDYTASALTTLRIYVAFDAGAPGILEQTSFNAPKSTFSVTADADQDTYIRVVLSDALSSGAIDWHCHYDPLSDDGFLEVS